MKESLFQSSTLISVIVGLGLGFLLKFKYPLPPDQTYWIETPGEIFLNMLQIFAVPLVVSSVIAGVTELSTKMSKRMAIIAGIYIGVTNLIAIAIGMTLVLMAEPGSGDVSPSQKLDTRPFSVHLIMQDLFRNMIPESFVQAFYEQYKTEIISSRIEESKDNISTNETDVQLVGTYIDGANMIGLIVWAFVIGIMLNRVGGQAKTTVAVIHSCNSAIKIIFGWILWYMPIGVLFLVANQVLEIQDWSSIIKLGKFAGLCLLGLTIQIFLVLPGIYFIILGRNPFVIFSKTSKALVTSLVIASSAATLPLTLQCCEENVRINPRLCRLMLPITATINMNGTAIYEVMASFFVAQIHEKILDYSQILAICLTVSVISFGTAGIPQTGATTTVLVLTSVGLPAGDAYILLVVEWILDHFVTLLNVLGDCFCVAVINYLCKDELVANENESPLRQAENDVGCLEPEEDLVPAFLLPNPRTHIP